MLCQKKLGRDESGRHVYVRDESEMNMEQRAKQKNSIIHDRIIEILTFSSKTMAIWNVN